MRMRDPCVSVPYRNARRPTGLLPLVIALGLLAGCGKPAEKAKPDRTLPPIAAEVLVPVTLPPVMQPHWVWLNDISFDRPLDGRAYLIDADKGAMLGMVSGGYAQGPLTLAPDGVGFSQVSTFYSRGTRGDRTDVVTDYLTSDLKPGAEVVMPPKTLKVTPLGAATAITDDGRFLLASNFTPAQSVTVVDRVEHKLVGEFDVPGCGLIYPVGARQFMTHCSDGSLELDSMGDSGQITRGKVGVPLSDATDPAMEKPVRIGPTRWLFVTFHGKVIIVDAAGGTPTIAAQWALGGEAGWRPGGLVPMAFHRASGKLFVLMHQGGDGSHKDPGTQLWVYDVAKGTRDRVMTLASPASAIAISPDAAPLLYTVNFGVDELIIYDGKTGGKRTSLTGYGHALTVLQPAPERW